MSIEPVEGSATYPDMDTVTIVEHAVTQAPLTRFDTEVDYDIYAAGPFFNDTQIATMNTAIKLMRDRELKVFDPREHGPVLGNMVPEERKKHTKEVLNANVSGVLRSYMTIACIDDRDTGTAWELGFGYAINTTMLANIPQITFSNRGFGANVMIGESVLGHCVDMNQLERWLHENLTKIKGRLTIERLLPPDVID